MTDTAVQQRRPAYAVNVAAAAATLGLLAFAADFVGGVVGHVVVALTSSGFAWGLAAVLAGRYAETTRRAATGATGLLVLATALYYLLILLVSRRWSGATLEDGSSANMAGLRSVAVMTSVWLAGSLLAGPLLGLLGHAVRANTTRSAALAAGTACGLLSAEGWHAIVQAPPWHLLASGDSFLYGVAFGEIVRVVLPLAVLVWLVAAHRLGRAWPMLLAATVAAATAGTLLWYALGLVQGV
ncbi:hypothetical protein [Micromonospora eburnea]|uniref:Uncharacterized protein n=1 Tax=Micromonospora eburnea TaxID=227316 RepID=A0A1C6UA28_9ACTN|nr:hypothetical protein [Micromonospora eburnea]SCL50887.1 hypothetical protein GA0070604_2234 [Micromonospora eburnea]